jgi:ribulose-5-phosphate 4-epimerase/fuculose-1-phosphate aldolase
VVTGNDIASAVYAAEELEETAKLLVLLRGASTRTLTMAQVDELGATFGKQLSSSVPVRRELASAKPT